MEWLSGCSLYRGLRTSCLTFTGICQLVNLVGALSIVKNPVSKGVHEGSTFTLNCVVESTNQVYVIWYKEDSPGSNVPLSSYRQIRREAPEWERLSIVGRGNAFNLRVVDAGAADQSNYQCIAYSRGSSVRSNVARVTVLSAGDSVDCQLYPQHVAVGAILNYTCRPPRSLSTAMLTWWRGSERVRSVQALPDGSLRLQHIVSEYDNYVRFTCTVGTDFSQAYGLNCSTVPLQVPLTGNLNPVLNKVSEGSNAAFRCSAIAAPPVSRIKWLVGFGTNAKISKSGGRYEIKSQSRDATESTLIIKNIAAVDNGTTVRCVVMNEIKQKDIAMAYVIVASPTDPIRTTDRPQIRTRNRITRRPRVTANVHRATRPPLITQRRPSTRMLTTRMLTRVYLPRSKDVEISVHDGIPTTDVIPAVNNGGIEEEGTGNSKPSSSSSLAPTVAVICVLLVLSIAIAGIVYFVVFRRKMLTKNNFNGEVKYRQSNNANGGETTAEERAAARMSLRLQTIEVVVNQPPPEWQSKLKDVKPVENEYTNFDDVPSSPPPAYTPKNSTEMEIIPSNNVQKNEKQNGADEEPEDDAIYALPEKKNSKVKGDIENTSRDHQNAKRQISDTRRRLLSQDYNDNNDDDDIEWDQSSWDDSSFEDEMETVERIREGHMYSGPAEKIYANTQEEIRLSDHRCSDEYGPEYGNLPNLHVDETDPNYSRVASLTA